MNGLALRIGLILLGKLVSPEVVTSLVNKAFTIVETKVKDSHNDTAEKILAEVEAVVTREEDISVILAFAQGLPKA